MGGSSGGGGSSGAQSWPEYLQNTHYSLLSHDGDDVISMSVIGAINTAIAGGNPYTNEVAFDPSDDIEYIITAIANFEDVVDELDPTSLWSTILDSVSADLNSVYSEDLIDTAVTAFSQDIQDELDNTILPTYRLGMRDQGSVNTSAYAVGEALLMAKKLHEVAKFDSEIRLANAKSSYDGVLHSVDKVLDSELRKIEFKRNVGELTTEVRRIAIVASKEFTDKQLEIDVLDSRWDLETYQYAANMMAAISGGTSTAQSKPIQTQSAIGGALSGAAAGAMVTGGTPIGAAIGGAIGLGASFF